MKIPLFIVLTVALGAGSVLAVMNNACKTSRHAWCAPTSEFRDSHNTTKPRVPKPSKQSLNGGHPAAFAPI
jgi:hypothetical protein